MARAASTTQLDIDYAGVLFRDEAERLEERMSWAKR